MMKAKQIKEKAIEIGFELVGIAPVKPVPDLNFYFDWLDRGYAGMMSYLERGREKRADPDKILPGIQSLICVGMNYFTEEPRLPMAVARYAWGKDYHEVLGQKLKQLEEFIVKEIDPAARTRSYVDTGPVLERSYAAQAGLGWIGKNTMLLNNGLGSYVFLGEILTTIEFEEGEYDRPVPDQCGTCTKCIDACPTHAFVEPYVLDSNSCISYLTIEYRGEFSEDQSKAVEGHLYGCDICQEVCPYNDRIPSTTLPELQIRPELQKLLESLESKTTGMSEADFNRLTDHSAMDRIKFKQWKRNLLSH